MSFKIEQRANVLLSDVRKSIIRKLIIIMMGTVWGFFFFPSSSLNKMIPYDSQCDQPGLCLFRSWVGNRTRHAAVCCVTWSWRGGGLPVSHGDPKLPRPGGLSLQARILLLNCKAWMSTPSC